MHPELFKIGPLAIHSYGFMIALGFLLSIWIAGKRANRVNIAPELLFDLVVYLIIAGIIGSRILHVAEYSNQFFTKPFLKNPYNVLDGGLNIPFAIIGWFAGTVIVLLILRSKKIRIFSKLLVVIIVSMILGIISGRSAFVVANRNEFDIDGFLMTLKVWEGGLTFYGGLIAGVLVSALYVKAKKINFAVLCDLLAPFIMLGLAFGRFGCFLFGCCYGKICEKCLLVLRFPKDSPAYNEHLQKNLIPPDATQSLPVVSTQLFESAIGLFLFFILSIIWKKQPKHGTVFLCMLILYATGRFVLEFFRGDNTPVFLGFTLSQNICLGLLIVALTILTFRFQKSFSTNNLF